MFGSPYPFCGIRGLFAKLRAFRSEVTEPLTRLRFPYMVSEPPMRLAIKCPRSLITTALATFQEGYFVECSATLTERRRITDTIGVGEITLLCDQWEAFEKDYPEILDSYTRNPA